MSAFDLEQYLRKRVKRKKNFYRHLGAYLIVVGGFYLLKIVAIWGPGPHPHQIIGLFWGIGLAFHFFKIFGLPGVGTLDEKWEEEEFRKEIQQFYLKTGYKPEADQEELELPNLKRSGKYYRDEDLV